jgi:hypothetical protein
MFFPDPGSDSFPSRIQLFSSRTRIKESNYFNTKKLFLNSRKYDPGLLIPDPDSDFFAIPDPGVKKAPDPDPQH